MLSKETALCYFHADVRYHADGTVPYTHPMHTPCIPYHGRTGPWTTEQQRSGSVGSFTAGWLRDSSDPACTVCPSEYEHVPVAGQPRRCVSYGTVVRDGMPCGADAGLGSSWEANLRMPTLIRWPGRVAPGTVSSELASTMDIFATVLAVAGVALPGPPPSSGTGSKRNAGGGRVYDGKDLTAVLEGTAKSPHQFLYFWRQFYVQVQDAGGGGGGGGGSGRTAGASVDPPAAAQVVQLPRPELAAVRSGAYKAHFATASGMGQDLKVTHDPPLVFQVEADPQEQYPLSAAAITASPAATAALAGIIAAAKEHVAGVAWTYGDGLTQARSSEYLLCCNRTNACRCAPASKCL